MRLTRNAALAGLASLALAGAAWAAGKPAKAEANVMTVALPGGGVATISYRGEIAPRVVVGSTEAAALQARAAADRFAEMDRFMAAMARRAALMRERMRLTMAALEAQARSGGARGPSGLTWVNLPGPAAGAALPPGTVSYSSVTRMVGGRSCTETVQVARTAADAQPQVVRRTSGDCAARTARPGVAPVGPARPAARPVRPNEVI